MTAVLAGCTALPGRPSAERPPLVDLRHELAAPASSVAWLLADLIETTFPATAPMPEAPGVAVVGSTGLPGQPDRFLVSARRRDDLSHVATTPSNGRLFPPQLAVDHSTRSVPPSLAPSRFRSPSKWLAIPARFDIPTSTSRGGDLLIEASIEGNSTSCRVEIRFGNTALARTALRDLRDHYLTGVTHLECAPDTVDAASTEPCCGRHATLTVPRLVRAAFHELGRLQPRAARALLRRALGRSVDPSAQAALAAVEQSLARPGDAAESWRRLANSSHVHRLTGRALRARAGRFERRDTTATVHTAADLVQSRTATSAAPELSAETLAARCWIDRALRGLGTRPRSGDFPLPEPTSLPRTLAILERFEGDSRVAFMTGIAELTAMRPTDERDPEWAIRLAFDSLEFGRPTVGLRVLARYWPEIRAVPEHSDTAIAAVRACAKAVGPETTSRVLATERAPDLLRRALETWQNAPAPDLVGIELLGRLDQLRRRHRFQADDIPNQPRASTPAAPGANRSRLLDYELAPGVSPPR